MRDWMKGTHSYLDENEMGSFQQIFPTWESVPGEIGRRVGVGYQ